MYPTSEPRSALAERFGLPYSGAMQDWEWEVADASRLEEFIVVYASGELSDAERWSLMELMIQSVEDIYEQKAHLTAWARIEAMLQEHQELHAGTIEYWACLGASKTDELFRVSVGMRRLLARGNR